MTLVTADLAAVISGLSQSWFKSSKKFLWKVSGMQKKVHNVSMQLKEELNIVYQPVKHLNITWIFGNHLVFLFVCLFYKIYENIQRLGGQAPENANPWDWALAGFLSLG